MANEIKKWDMLQKDFDTANKGKMGPRAADNVLIAWPVILQFINDYHSGKSRVLDYGCGTGGFCRRLRTEGLDVEGIDFSPAMIRAATKHSSGKIKYHLGDKKVLEKIPGKFDIITAIMVFQFMKDFEAYIPVFRNMLSDRGIIAFAVYNPEFVKGCYQEKVLFKSWTPAGKTAVARLEMKKGVQIDTYVRTKERYRELFEKNGFEFLSLRYPPFTQEFIANYKWNLPSENAEYLIILVRKKTL